MISVPVKPFPEYKWQWATVTCTEGLNDPSVYLGILRALYKFEGKPPSDPDFNALLNKIQRQTKTNVQLARSPERNIIRNSGQYWKALSLLDDNRGLIHLSRLGSHLANGNITPIEFATYTVKTLELPNVKIQHDIQPWLDANLKIKPLELIVSLISELGRALGPSEGYITPFELVKIVIPLAGEKASVEKHISALSKFRKGSLNLDTWPDCAPGANDKRMAREFLLFLSYYGICKKENDGGHENERYYLQGFESSEVSTLIQLKVDKTNTAASIKKINESALPAQVERKKKLAEILARPEQPLFRRNILIAFQNKCIITGVDLPDVLEAAHIIPVRKNGNDRIANGLCLRSDIHSLFDAGHLRIEPDGHLHLSDTARKERNYGALSGRIRIPDFVNREFLAWRFDYQ